MINKVILVGRLGQDIELKKTVNNTSTCNFSLACNRNYRSANGNQETDWIRCVAWRQSAEFLANYAKKGSIIGVEGRLQVRSFEGQNGKVNLTEVVCENVQIIGSRNSNNETSYNEPKQTFTPSAEASYSDQGEEEDDFSSTPSFNIASDDLPFY